ncbi:hypothetical protein U3A55_06320 [Salarchaeum sp. III]|uniref:DUF7551 domain-containing protein n=1 Tax=Salarchaeum sp. III TaxID=3107927 RepID=UPI002ED9C063
MLGDTLTGLRSRIETLATPDGTYTVTCGRTNNRVVPIDDRRFSDRETAAEAIRLAEQYRATLRRYDPRVPCTDPIALETTDLVNTPLDPDTPATHVEHCHRIAAAVFETLAERNHNDVQNAVLDAYLDAAETTGQSRLCRHLVERLASELDTQLDPTTQAAIVATSADKLPSAPTDPATALDRLHAAGLFDTYTHVQDERNPATHYVTLTGYLLTPTDGALPTLPLTLGTDTATAVTAATGVTSDSWHLTLTTTPRPAHSRTLAPVSDDHSS